MGEQTTPFTWGLEKLNQRFGLPDKRDLITLFWYMSCWKTEFTYFVARENVRAWNAVCYISLELPEYDMKLRIARKCAWIKKIDYQRGNYTDYQKSIMDEKLKELNTISKLFIVKPEKSDIWEITKTMHEYYDKGCRMFIIDNLDKISWPSDENKRYQEISSTLQNEKNEFNTCIILIHHAKKPMNIIQAYTPAWMSGIRWSQKILDNSTQVFEIWRNLDPDTWNDPKEKAKVEIYQLKDTFEWANGFETIYFNKWVYQEEWE